MGLGQRKNAIMESRIVKRLDRQEAPAKRSLQRGAGAQSQMPPPPQRVGLVPITVELPGAGGTLRCEKSCGEEARKKHRGDGVTIPARCAGGALQEGPWGRANANKRGGLGPDAHHVDSRL